MEDTPMMGQAIKYNWTDAPDPARPDPERPVPAGTRHGFPNWRRTKREREETNRAKSGS